MTAKTPTPSFRPYTLTPLDHLLPPQHVFAYMSFRPEQPSEAVVAIESGLLELISQWPFLAGNVARVQRKDRDNVLELQPPTASDLHRCPMLLVKHHQQTISQALASPVINYGMLHIPTTVSNYHPIPAVRFQANVMRDGLILCLSWYHQVMDSLGVAIILHALSRFSSGRDRKSAAPRRLPMNPDKEEQARRRINQAASYNNSDLRDAYCGISYDEDEQIRGLIGRVKERDDYSAIFGAPAEVIMSSLRKTNIYTSDWGTTLGPLLDFDTIDARTDGLTLILPDRTPSKRDESAWEVRMNLPVNVMEEFEKDELVRWVTEAGKLGARL
ncbi:hypothetical protein AbraIFM66951_004253 [Aspergillus brasiliensis]|uniref:Trichothecene 3-O-acetyltransferase-like N-terminal domain-containing protein n=1 Tax=Aspergillus brasiliensis TaxID=319629 RepID=A0A9W5YUT4_9EURO|nr:hypothetical protein AbraCBS73388_008926 [Aspergillus brasiliensis]GKZ40584.1 hypothetical protein AbraIFM66951_004253 [Aspergillus brasiliensis]